MQSWGWLIHPNRRLEATTEHQTHLLCRTTQAWTQSNSSAQHINIHNKQQMQLVWVFIWLHRWCRAAPCGCSQHLPGISRYSAISNRMWQRTNNLRKGGWLVYTSSSLEGGLGWKNPNSSTRHGGSLQGWQQDTKIEPAIPPTEQGNSSN